MESLDTAPPDQIPEPKLSRDSVLRKGIGMIGLRDLSALQGARGTRRIRDSLASIHLAKLAKHGGVKTAAAAATVGGDDMGDSLQAGDNQNYTYHYHGSGLGKVAGTALLSAVLGGGAALGVGSYLLGWFDKQQDKPAAEFKDTDTDTQYDLDFVE